MNQRRLARLTDEILAQGLDGIALIPGPNMHYISSIPAHVSERPIVLFIPADDEPVIVIPRLEAMKAQDAGIPNDRIFAWSDEEGYTGAFQQACAFLELTDFLLGVESLHMRVLEYELLKRYAPGVQTTHAEPVLDALRMVKDADELAAMERAVAVAENAMHALLPRIQIGMTERELASMLVRELLDQGAHSLSFEPIVATGPNSAVPHAMPGERPLQAGDLLVVDWGAYVDGYPSDITRTFAVGEIDRELERIYRAVQVANEQGKLAAAPGVPAENVDRAARSAIEEVGYGDYFIHRTGHGLGLEVHEGPNIVAGNSAPLEVGNVFTVEPGIYLPGRGGVRIEDDVVITPEGNRSLTNFPRELITVG